MVIVASKTGTRFRTTELLDFNVEDNREISIYQTDGGTPTTYLLKKYVNAQSAELKTMNMILEHHLNNFLK